MQTNANLVVSLISNSLDIYDGLLCRNIKKSDLFEVLKKKDNLDKLRLEEISNKRKEKLLKDLNKESYLDELLDIKENKYTHLKEIRHLVNLDELMEFILPDNIYIEKVKIHYADLIIDILTEKFYDYNDLKILSKIKENIDNVEKKLNQKILKKLDEYYVIKITV